MKISFCIPSLNRPEYLCQTIKSICSNVKFSSDFEVIVYNNFSDVSYSIVEETINTLSINYNINYKIGTSRLDIDRSMFAAMYTAKGEYLFLIGDDDFLFVDGIETIFDLVVNTEFDMAVFNAILINDFRNTKTELIGFSGRTYNRLDLALIDIRIYCAYSNLLIKRKFFIESDFTYLIGSSHAYGSFWLAFFREFEMDINPIIIVPKEHVVYMRTVEKNYKILDVIYKDIDLEFELYYNVIGDKSRQILKRFEKNYWKQHSSLKQLVYYAYCKNDLRNIKQLNPVFYKNNLIKIHFSSMIAAVIIPIIKPVRDLFREKSR